MNNKLKTLGLASVLVTCSAVAREAQVAQPGQEKIQALINSIDVIQSRLENGESLSVGAVGYASIGKVVPDGVLADSEITQVMLDNYIAAKDAVEGESWSNDTGSIADMIVEFHRNKCNEMREVIRKGTVNRRYFKGWESILIDMLEGK